MIMTDEAFRLIETEMFKAPLDPEAAMASTAVLCVLSSHCGVNLQMTA